MYSGGQVIHAGCQNRFIQLMKILPPPQPIREGQAELPAEVFTKLFQTVHELAAAV